MPERRVAVIVLVVEPPRATALSPSVVREKSNPPEGTGVGVAEGLGVGVAEGFGVGVGVGVVDLMR